MIDMFKNATYHKQRVFQKLSICMQVCVFVQIFQSQPFYHSFLYTSISISSFLSIFYKSLLPVTSLYLSICLSNYLTIFTQMSIYLSGHKSTFLSFYLYVNLSLYFSFYIKLTHEHVAIFTCVYVSISLLVYLSISCYIYVCLFTFISSSIGVICLFYSFFLGVCLSVVLYVDLYKKQFIGC